MATETEHTIEHELNVETTSDDLLANLSEQEENRVQLSEIRRMTVEPGLMRLPVSTVATAQNSPNWAIEVDHPIEGTLRFFRDAPVEGWADEPDTIVRLLKWYGIQTEDPYQLQLTHVYVEKTNSSESRAHGWELVEPPEYDPPIPVQLNRKWGWFHRTYRPRRTYVKMWVVLCIGAGIAALLPPVPMLPVIFGQIVSSVIGFVFVTILGMIVLDPEADQ